MRIQRIYIHCMTINQLIDGNSLALKAFIAIISLSTFSYMRPHKPRASYYASCIKQSIHQINLKTKIICKNIYGVELSTIFSAHMELSRELFFQERLDLRVIFFINSEPCFFLRSLQNLQGHFEVNIFRENLLYFSLNAIVFCNMESHKRSRYFQLCYRFSGLGLTRLNIMLHGK